MATKDELFNQGMDEKGIGLATFCRSCGEPIQPEEWGDWVNGPWSHVDIPPYRCASNHSRDPEYTIRPMM